MKFTDGYWMVREGYTVNRPAEAYEVATSGDALRILAPTGRISSRGDTLNRPAATITISSPLAGVLRVHIVHHSGSRHREPSFELPGAGRATGVDRHRGAGGVASPRVG